MSGNQNLIDLLNSKFAAQEKNFGEIGAQLVQHREAMGRVEKELTTRVTANTIQINTNTEKIASNDIKVDANKADIAALKGENIELKAEVKELKKCLKKWRQASSTLSVGAIRSK